MTYKNYLLFFIESAPLGRFDLVVAMSACMYVVCPLPMRFFFRPLIGQHRSHDYFQGLSLVTAPGVKIGCINKNNICVGALHFDPWCTINLLSGQHKSHHHFPGLSLYWCYNPHRSRDLIRFDFFVLVTNPPPCIKILKHLKHSYPKNMFIFLQALL